MAVGTSVRLPRDVKLGVKSVDAGKDMQRAEHTCQLGSPSDATLTSETCQLSKMGVVP